MSLLGKAVAGAKASGAGEFIRAGEYTLMIEKIFENKGYEGECIIAEFRVVNAEAFDGVLDEQGKPVRPNPVGSTCSVVFNVTKNREAALGNAKKLAMALFDIVEDDFTAEIYDAMIANESAETCRGMLLNCKTKQIENKGRATPANKGKMMTIPFFTHVEGQTEESIKAGRAKLGAPKAREEKPVEEEAKSTAQPGQAKSKLAALGIGKKA